MHLLTGLKETNKKRAEEGRRGRRGQLVNLISQPEQQFFAKHCHPTHKNHNMCMILDFLENNLHTECRPNGTGPNCPQNIPWRSLVAEHMLLSYF